MKKTISILSVLLLVATVFVGCGKSVDSIDFSKTTVDVSVGETYQVEYTVVPNDVENVEISWTSSDDNIASVDDKGIVTAVAAGSAVITATSGKVSSTCKFNITKPQVAVIDTITGGYTRDKSKTYTVGESMKIDEFGQVIEVKDYYNTNTFEYDSNGKLVTAKVKDDDTTGISKWTYKDIVPISSEENPNDGFRCSRKGKITCKVNAENEIEQLIEKEKLTDPEDGSIDNRETIYEYHYENGLITTIDCTIDGKKDHYTTLTYDKKGNITSYSNFGYTEGEYIRFEITYKMVDEDTVSKRELSSFTNLYNLENIIIGIL